MRRVALPVIIAVIVSSLVASPVPPSAAQAADDPLPRVIVPLDAATEFALDRENDAPVELGEGETGTVALQFPDDEGANTVGGSVQVFRPGDGTPADRWVGRVAIARTAGSGNGDASFELPAGDYQLFFEGFTGIHGARWRWFGGAYDATAAQTVSVTSGGEAVIDMAHEGTDVAGVSAQLLDRYDTEPPAVELIVYTVLERHGREELMPLGSAASGGLAVLIGARVTALAVGAAHFRDTWYPGEASLMDAAVVDVGEYGVGLQLPLLQTARVGLPLVGGVAVVGQELRARHARPWNATHTYQWLADGLPIAGQTQETLRVGSALTGKRISFRVETTGASLVASSATSLATPRVTKPPTPKVTGWMLPGEVMRVSPGTWPTGTKLSIQWTLNGFAIPGATKTSLVVPSDGMTREISATITATRPAYETVMLEAHRDYAPFVVPHRAASGVAAELPSSQPTGEIDGYVTGPKGASVSGATVRVYWAGSGIERETTPRLVETGNTDWAGYFAFPDLKPGQYCLEVEPPAGSRLNRLGGDCGTGVTGYGVLVFADASASTEMPLQLDPEARITGTVTSSTGAVVPGATVSVYRSGYSAAGVMSLTKVATATAGSTGRYTLGGLGGDGYYIRIAGPSSLSHKPEWWSNRQYARSSAHVWLERGVTKTVNASIAAYLPIGIPKISGNAIVGGTLTASHPVTSGATYRYQWSANGVAISGATKRSYSVPSSLEGRTITVSVVGARSNYLTTGRRSEATPRVLRAATPTIAGTRAVGSRLTANAGTWTTGTVFAYRWYRDGAPIDGATDRTYVLQPADRGHRLTVKIRGTKAGYATTARTSSPTWPIAR